MNNKNTAVLLMNVGSPDAPTKAAVRRYLSEFLNDKRVIDLPWLLRKILVNLIIIPFRVKKSTALYQQLWTTNRSPLIFYSEELKNKLQTKLDDNFKVFLGMRYGNPGYKKALADIKQQNFEKLIVVPLFPQHALSTTETAFEAVKSEIKEQNVKIELVEIQQFYYNPDFIKVFVNQIKKYQPDAYDHIVFSYHGIPLRQDEKSHPTNWQSIEKYAYSKACLETTNLIVEGLGLAKENYSIGFQSRLSKNWLSPFTDELILSKLNTGNKKILVVTPSFVTDCLETIIEIRETYKQKFIANVGEQLQLVESLNDNNEWVEVLKKMIIDVC